MNKGEIDLSKLIRSMRPTLHEGTYVFTTVPDLESIPPKEMVGFFREEEGFSVIVDQQKAESLGLKHTFAAAWITLEVHSSLEAVGLTAAFSTALSHEGISCNVIAGFYHDHLFVAKEQKEKAMSILRNLQEKGLTT